MTLTPEGLVLNLCFVIRGHRERLKFSQEGFSDTADINRNYYGKIERGQQPGVSMRALQRIAIGLGVPLSQLVAEAEVFDPAVREPPSPPRVGRPRGSKSR